MVIKLVLYYCMDVVGVWMTQINLFLMQNHLHVSEKDWITVILWYGKLTGCC